MKMKTAEKKTRTAKTPMKRICSVLLLFIMLKPYKPLVWWRSILSQVLEISIIDHKRENISKVRPYAATAATMLASMKNREPKSITEMKNTNNIADPYLQLFRYICPRPGIREKITAALRLFTDNRSLFLERDPARPKKRKMTPKPNSLNVVIALKYTNAAMQIMTTIDPTVNNEMDSSLCIFVSPYLRTDHLNKPVIPYAFTN
jgi:hypothetical protein